MNIFWPW